MVFGNFRLSILIRIAILIVLITISVLTWLHTTWIITGCLLLISVGISAYELIHYVEDSNRNFSGFLLAIRNTDFTRHEITDPRGKSFEELKLAFNTIIDEFQATRTAKEAQYSFLQSVISHLSTAIICFDSEENVKLINEATYRLLDMPVLNNLKYIKKISSKLYDYLLNGNNEVVEVTLKEEKFKLLIRSTRFKLQERPHTLALITNVKTEIDRAETDAWQQLLRVLTHEIMNSITPIASLSDTIKNEFDDILTHRSFKDEQLDELSEALSVIKGRSEGLINFVHHYKSLIHLPAPVLKSLPVNAIVENIHRLTNKLLQSRGIRLSVISPRHLLTILADKSMIEQVILNLINNAADALQSAVSPAIVLTIEESGGHIILTISDNGCGIDAEILDKIFIPFFTTKANGTGIGLSLSKRIMHLHKGYINVHSSKNTGTTFSLSFPKA